MSLYRQAGGFSPRTLALVAVAALLVGALAGYLAGRGSVDEPSVADLAAEARNELRPVAAGIELIPIEYEGAVDAGGVAAPTELEATQGAASRAEEALEASAGDMKAIDPAGYAAARRSLTELSAAIDAVAAPARVNALARAAEARVAALAGA
jgi:hypothetical protein